ncbi:MAG: HAD family hydrolase [Armatimonadetes bacterium]|nr:HAD family hydrolase [Armatimonadota bacterium]
MIRAIIFDLDDTLCDYIGSVQAARELVLDQIIERYPHLDRGAVERASEDIFRDISQEILEMPLRAIYLKDVRALNREGFLRLFRRYALPDPDACAFAERYETLRRSHFQCFPEAKSALRTLAARYPLGLITNGPADNQAWEIEFLKIAPYFKIILIEGQLGFGKPEERIYRLALSALGADPGETLFVGNSLLHDIQGPQIIGMKTAWVNRCREPLHDQGPVPDHVVSSLEEIEGVLEEEQSPSGPRRNQTE